MDFAKKSILGNSKAIYEPVLLCGRIASAVGYHWSSPHGLAGGSWDSPTERSSNEQDNSNPVVGSYYSYQMLVGSGGSLSRLSLL